MIQDSTAPSFWQSTAGKVLRWILFLPAGMLALALLYVLPVLAIATAIAYKPEFNFFTLMLGLLAISLLSTLAWFWFLGVMFAPNLICRVIAPNNKVASIIFGTVFCLDQLRQLPLSYNNHWINLIYQLVFAGIVLTGITLAHGDER